MRKILNVHGTQNEKPNSIDVNVDTVYIRNNIIRVETKEFTGWQYDELQYEKNEYIESIAGIQTNQVPLVERVKTATEIYEENKDKSELSLDDLKMLRIGKLKEECTQAIENGFTASGMFFGFNTIHDQANFTQQLLLVVAGYSDAIQWKTKNMGVVELTSIQFQQICAAAELHKRTQQLKYWNLEQQILAATDKSTIKLIEWV